MKHENQENATSGAPASAGLGVAGGPRPEQVAAMVVKVVGR